MGRIKQHINLNTVLMTVITGVFMIIADIGIKKVDNTATALAVVQSQLDQLHRDLDSKVTRDEFKSEIRRIDVELDGIGKNNNKSPHS